jgi:hypothetical protein
MQLTFQSIGVVVLKGANIFPALCKFLYIKFYLTYVQHTHSTLEIADVCFVEGEPDIQEYGYSIKTETTEVLCTPFLLFTGLVLSWLFFLIFFSQSFKLPFQIRAKFSGVNFVPILRFCILLFFVQKNEVESNESQKFLFSKTKRSDQETKAKVHIIDYLLNSIFPFKQHIMN